MKSVKAHCHRVPARFNEHVVELERQPVCGYSMPSCVGHIPSWTKDGFNFGYKLAETEAQLVSVAPSKANCALGARWESHYSREVLVLVRGQGGPPATMYCRAPCRLCRLSRYARFGDRLHHPRLGTAGSRGTSLSLSHRLPKSWRVHRDGVIVARIGIVGPRMVLLPSLTRTGRNGPTTAWIGNGARLSVAPPTCDGRLAAPSARTAAAVAVRRLPRLLPGAAAPPRDQPRSTASVFAHRSREE